MLEFKLVHYKNNIYSYGAFENGEKKSECDFSIDKQFVEIISLKAYNKDEPILEGIIKSALFYASNKNAYIAKINPQNIDSNIFIRMGFKEKDGFLCNDIPSALSCSCSKDR